MKNMGGLLRHIDNISNCVGKLASFLILCSMGVVLFEVLMRYALSLPTTWCYEMSLFIFGTFAALGGAYTFLHGGHVRMDIVHSRLSPRGKAIMDLVTFIFVFIFLGVLVWKGWEFAWRAFQLSERTDSAWGPLLWPTKLIIPIAAFLMLLQGLAKFVRDIFMATARGSLDEH